MGQQVVVATLKKQIMAKKSALESALKLSKELSEKRQADVKQADEEYAKVFEAWEKTVIEIALKQPVTKDRVRIQSRYYNDTNITVEIIVPEKKFSKAPERKYKDAKEYEVVIPRYFDSRNELINPAAVLAHFNKALDMLEVLPSGTVEITVKDFSFLTKF